MEFPNIADRKLYVDGIFVSSEACVHSMFPTSFMNEPLPKVEL